MALSEDIFDGHNWEWGWSRELLPGTDKAQYSLPARRNDLVQNVNTVVPRASEAPI